MTQKKKLIEVALPLAAVLNTPRAIEVSVFVVRVFVRLREILTTHKTLAHKLAELESKIETHEVAIRSLVSAIRQLMASPEKQPKKIGFQLREKRAAYGRRQELRKQFLAFFAPWREENRILGRIFRKKMKVPISSLGNNVP